ncbi:MAG: DUF3298 domain-containing protein [Anaerotignum sp.]|nr:DUF3298 domain-containing protein [Anaerotignum sp.]
MNPEYGKKAYESIPIPEKLNEMVAQTIASQNKEDIRMSYENTKTTYKTTSRRPVWKGCMAAAAAFLVAGTIGLNASPAFAEEMGKVPVIGQLAQVLTFRSFEGTVGDVELDVTVPVVKGADGKELPAKVNAQIQQLTANYEAQAKADLAEYKKSFFAAGGTEEEWADRTMSLFIDYDVKYFKDDILSLQVTTAKSWVSAEEAYHFYNIDLKKDAELTLADVLGDDYAEICNTAIVNQINERLAADENAAFFGFGNDDGLVEGFTTVTEDTPFYLNAEGDVVISFPEYSIAPGSMGIQEFVIS